MSEDDAALTSEAGDSSSIGYLYRFGSAEFDGARGELRIGGLIINSQPKPLQMLALLLQRPGEVLSKDELAATLWQEAGADDAPSDAMIANAASKLRQALGEENARRLVTLPRVGYRFDGPIERVAMGRRQPRAASSELAPGLPVPGRERYRLAECLGGARGQAIWLARHPRSEDRRVFKFALDGERLADLKREVTLSRLLHEALGEREDILRVLDWNFERAPYWIELPHAGASLDRWSAEPAEPGGTTRLADLPRAQRVAWVADLAAVVGAAHDVGVLHQDLKPANVLVSATAQGGWQLRLTDFGSGRLLEPERLRALQITQQGLTVSSLDATSGTPLYMAPELLRGEGPTTRSDVFALGVMLYQILAGDFRRALLPGWERDVDDPLLREDIAAATDQDAVRRLGSASQLAARLRGLEARRAALAEQQAQARRAAEVTLHLSRARARRPWIQTAGALLLAGLATSLWLYVGQRRLADALAGEVAASRALNQLLGEDLIGAASPKRNGRAGLTVADAVAQAASGIETRFAGTAPAVRGRLHAAVQSALSDLSRAQDAVVAGRLAVQALSDAGPSEVMALAAARLRLALDLVQLSQLDEARTVLHDVDADQSTLARFTPEMRVRLYYTRSWLTAGDLSMQQSSLELEQAMALIARTPGFDASLRRVVAFGLADNYAMLERYGEAEALYRPLREEQLREYGPRDARPLYTAVGLGRTLMLAGRLDEAEPMLRDAADGLADALGAGHRQSLDARSQLAELRFRRQDWDGAARAWQPVRSGFVALLGEGSSYTVTIQTNLALALHYGHHLPEAERELRSALAHVRGFVKEGDPQAQQIRYALADCLLDRGQSGEAAALLNGLQPEALNLAQPQRDWAARLDYQQARLALARGDRVQAGVLLRRAEAGRKEDDGHWGASNLLTLHAALR
ncbi:MAG: winged helix-turn-helix domain-containing protein [Proteobacteria bacterium]|nr:winged helix-turn-helix domain-containing protein [Pseudomonadota bacterium]